MSGECDDPHCEICAGLYGGGVTIELSDDELWAMIERAVKHRDGMLLLSLAYMVAD